MEYTAEEYLKRIENTRLNSRPLYSRKEMTDFAEKYAKAITVTHCCKSEAELLFAYEKFLDSEVNDSDVTDNINAFLSK